MEDQNQPLFTRGRLSRGKGLRKTTGCLTCRRRHVKCDEGKPRCGGCIRKDASCEYASRQQEANRRSLARTSTKSQIGVHTRSSKTVNSNTVEEANSPEDISMDTTEEFTLTGPEPEDQTQSIMETSWQLTSPPSIHAPLSNVRAEAPPKYQHEQPQHNNQQQPQPQQVNIDPIIMASQDHHQSVGPSPGDANSVPPPVFESSPAQAPSITSSRDFYDVGGVPAPREARHRHSQTPAFGMPSPNELRTQAAHTTSNMSNIGNNSVPLGGYGVLASATPDSGANLSVSTSGGVESLTTRWLDLLIGDVTMNFGPLGDFVFDDPSGLNIFGNSIAHTPVPTNPEEDDEENRRHRNGAVDGTLGAAAGSDIVHGSDKATTISESNPYMRERILFSGDQLKKKEQAWQALEPIELKGQEHVLFRHFVERLSLWMDMFEPQKPFGTLVPHLALHNVGLLNAILALSSRHLYMLDPGNSPPYVPASFRPDPNDTVSYYYKTLHYSQKAMQFDTYQTSLELLASAIIISSYEMLDGSSTDWEKHLKGVFWIQRSQVIHGDSGGLRQAVWWAWLCQDVWAAFREKRKPLTFWKPVRTLAELSPSELSARSVYYFAHVVAYCAEEPVAEGGREEEGHSSKYAAPRIHQADRLLQWLEQWRAHLTVEFNPLPVPGVMGVDDDGVFPAMWIQPAACGVALQVYYCSLILINLHRPCHGGFKEYLGRQRTLKRWASMVCGIAKCCTEYSTSVLTSQCVFIAGMVIEDSRERAAVLNLLDINYRRAGWPGFSLGRELQDVWQTGLGDQSK